MPVRELIIPPGMENIYEQKRYSPGVKVGNLIFVSGMLGRDENLNIVFEREDQFVQLFENMGKVLTAAGASFADVVDLTGYFTELQRDMSLFQTVRDRYITGELPAQTLIGVTELSTPGLILELKCTAAVA
ncbi:MAG: RidA family protein [Rhodospirillales bacterium]|jgi:enamine deaminase RidA (YjgF/YER057c/UK114 family)|nr:RidA family protein [Rhodospirillales bacterium]